MSTIRSAQVAKSETAFAGTRVILQQRVDQAAAWARAVAACTLLGAVVGQTLNGGVNAIDDFLPALGAAAPIYFIISFYLRNAGGRISRVLAMLAGIHVLSLLVYAVILRATPGKDDRAPMYFAILTVTMSGLGCTIFSALRAQGQSSEGRGFEVMPRQLAELDSEEFQSDL